jgi:hypothetical protein
MNWILLPRRVIRAIGILALAAGLATPALAHHSAAMFDTTKTVVQAGTVKQFLWTNPHSLLVLSVRGSNGVVADYNYEANGPGYLVRNGWTREILKPGDQVTVVSNPLVDGGPGGNLVEVTLADGRKLSAKPQLTGEGEGEKK